MESFYAQLRPWALIPFELVERVDEFRALAES